MKKKLNKITKTLNKIIEGFSHTEETNIEYLKFDIVSLFDVDLFNVWFCSEKSYKYYANKGIFLRTDKLSTQTIYDFLEDKHKIVVNNLEFDISLDIYDFKDEIVNDWNKKRNI